MSIAGAVRRPVAGAQRNVERWAPVQEQKNNLWAPGDSLFLIRIGQGLWPCPMWSQRKKMISFVLFMLAYIPVSMSHGRLPFGQRVDRKNIQR